MGYVQLCCATDSYAQEICGKQMLHKVKHTGGGLRGRWGGATKVLPDLAATPASKAPTEPTHGSQRVHATNVHTLLAAPQAARFRHMYWLIRYAAHFF